MRKLVEAHEGPLAIRLDVGLPESVPPGDQHDLDNYLLPLVAHLERRRGPRFVSVWATRRHAEFSCAVVEPANLRSDAVDLTSIVAVRTTASADSTAYKQQIADQVGVAALLPEGPVALELGFVVGQRNWFNLWKSIIDALGGLLGRADAHRDWHPKDGRITELGLHCTSDASLRYDVEISITARAL